MFKTAASAARVARSSLLLLAAIALQPIPVRETTEPVAPSQARPAVVFAGPVAPLPVPGPEQESGNGDGRAESDGAVTRGGLPARRGVAVGACTASFCPWRAPDALARAGRRSSPSTAPPVSPA